MGTFNFFLTSMGFVSLTLILLSSLVTDLLEDAAETAYATLSSGLTALQSEAAWDDIQRLQDDLSDSISRRGFNSAPTVETLLAQVDIAKAQREIAVANLAELFRGSREEEIEAFRAQVDEALASLNSLNVQSKKFTISAPWDGIVLTRSVEPGEAVMPGNTLLNIGRLDFLELTFYLPEDQFGHLKPGQSVKVQVDSYPNEFYPGTVLRVADESEFTPSNIQTKDDRVRLVYAVVIGLENPDLKLKPGMIADATFE